MSTPARERRSRPAGWRQSSPTVQARKNGLGRCAEAARGRCGTRLPGCRLLSRAGGVSWACCGAKGAYLLHWA
eukprot:scaffold58037_cov28-Tisochrysis_lutea.AAC.2